MRLNRITTGFEAAVYIKADYMNPGGSVKDRIGVSMIDEAERRGLLKPGGTIIEGTSGNTGIGLALVGAVRGYKLVFTITDKQSKEKVDLLKALGAEVIVCPTAVEPDDPRSYYSVAKKLAKDIPNSFYPNQYENPMNPEAHYRTTGPEIWEDSEGKITHFICGMGTGGTISGVGRYLKEKNPNVKIIGVDPIGSLYYEFFKTGKIGKAKTYVVEGIGEDIFPATMNFKIVDDVVQVNDQECFIWARRLVKQEGIFTGGSGGGCVSGALRVAKSLPKGSFVVAFYLTQGCGIWSKVYSDEWMRERGYVDSEVPLTAEDVVNAKHKNRKGPRINCCQARTDRIPRAAHDADAGYFSVTCVRGAGAGRRHLRRPDPESGAAGQRPAQNGDPRSDDGSVADSSLRGCGRAPHVSVEPRRARRIRPDGQRPLRNHYEVRPDGHNRRIDGAEAVSIAPASLGTQF